MWTRWPQNQPHVGVRGETNGEIGITWTCPVGITYIVILLGGPGSHVADVRGRSLSGSGTLDTRHKCSISEVYTTSASSLGSN